MLGRLIVFNLNSDHNTFISYVYGNRDSIKKKIKDFVFTKELNSDHYKESLISKIKKTGIETYYVSLSKNDLLHFTSVVKFMENNASRSDGEKINKYRKVKVEHKGIKYDAKLKLHLGEPRHWMDPKKVIH